MGGKAPQSKRWGIYKPLGLFLGQVGKTKKNK